MSPIPNARVYLNPRPVLLVERGGSRQLGNCYGSASYRITSTRPLSAAELASLREVGVIGYGQEHYVKFVTAEGQRIPVPADYAAKSTGVDIIQCFEVDNAGTVVRCPALNPYTGLECKPMEQPYFVYEVEDRVDSSD